jgi:hypothetical protein
MPYDEFVKWQQYFEIRPVGWREDDRTLKLLQIQGFKGAPDEVFMSFASMKKSNDNGLKNSMVFNLIRNAKGGVKLKE